MTVTIRTIKDCPQTYLAFASLSKGATFLLCFTNNVFGAMSLHDFTEMLRKYFNLPEIDLAFRDLETHPDSEALLGLLSPHD